MEGYGQLNKIINLTKFCCCSGRTAVLFIGWFGIVWNSIAFISTCFSGASNSNDLFAEAQGTVLAFIFLYKFGSNGFLLWGIYKERPLFIFPWLCVHISALLVFPIIMIVIFVLPIPAGTAAAVFIIFGCIIGIYTYTILLIHTHYEDLRSREAELFFSVRSPVVPGDPAQSPPVML